MNTSETMKDTRGSALLAVLILALVIAGLAGAYLQSTVVELKNSQRTLYLQSAMNLAEAGAEEAIRAYNEDDWTNWNWLGNGRYSRAMSFAGKANETHRIRVLADVGGISPLVIFAEGYVGSGKISGTKQLHIRTKQGGLFANGLTAKGAITFTAKTYIDSYNSSLGPYNKVNDTNWNDRGSVGSVSVVNEAVDIGHATIYGYLSTGGGAYASKPHASVRGKDTPDNVKIDENRIAYDFFADFPMIDVPSMSSPITTVPTKEMGSADTKTYYRLDSWAMNSSKDEVVIKGDVVLVVTGDMTIKGSLKLAEDSSIEIYAYGDIDIGGKGIMNFLADDKTPGTPADVQIYGMGTADQNPRQEIKLHGNGALVAAVYAPNADLTLGGGGTNGSMYGAAVANSISFAGNNYDFHYDEALEDLNKKRDLSLAHWRELIGADERLDFDVFFPKQEVFRNGKLLEDYVDLIDGALGYKQ